MVTFVKARVAVWSKGLASAAAEGLRTPPARETEMTILEGVADEVIGAVIAGAVTFGSDAVTVTVTVAGVQATVRSSNIAGRADIELATTKTVKMSLIMIAA